MGGGAGHHSAMLVRRSNSSAILPLRKHLIEKTLADRTLDDMASGFYLSSSLSATAGASAVSSAASAGGVEAAGGIKPIEEVMEEDGKQRLVGDHATGKPHQPFMIGVHFLAGRAKKD